MNFLPLLSKELRELARSHKLVFVPLVFALLAIGQPVSYKLMPKLLAAASNLPKGTVIQIPTPGTGEIVASVLGQVGQLGLLLLVLVAMGSVAGERQSGVAATVLTKPVYRGAYLSAKVVAFGLLAAFSLALGLGLGGYYTQVLFEPVNWAGVWHGYALYLPNLLLAVAITIAFSALLPSPVAAAGAALAVYIGLSTVPAYLGAFARQAYPGSLTRYAVRAIIGLPLKDSHVGSLTFPGASLPVTAVLALALIFVVLGWLGLRRQEI